MKKSVKKTLCVALASVLLVSAVPAAQAATPFTDVSSDSWYVNFVDYAYNHKLMAGTSDTTFAPNQIMTRGMLVTVLHSIAGKPTHSGNNPFSDVGDSWFSNAVIWCYEHGIVAGTSATTFSPNNPITREQMVAILFKFATTNGLDTSSRADLSGYEDCNRIESYAKDAFSWAVAKGVISGTSDTTLSPKGQATRAQCATILQRYHELLNAKPEPTEPAPTTPPTTTPTEPKPTTPPTTAPTEPTPTVHTHTWEKRICNHGGNTDDPMPGEGTWVSTGVTYPTTTVPQLRCTECGEIGHWEKKYVCVSCGWTCTEAQARAKNMDIGSYWNIYHQYSPNCNASYDLSWDWIVDVPETDAWVCTSCGEITTTNPN